MVKDKARRLAQSFAQRTASYKPEAAFWLAGLRSRTRSEAKLAEGYLMVAALLR